MLNGTAEHPALWKFCKCLLQRPASERLQAIADLIGFQPGFTLEQSFAIGPLRALFADSWEEAFQEPVPIARLREVACLLPRVEIKSHLIELLDVSDVDGLCLSVDRLLRFMRKHCAGGDKQRLFFGNLDRSESKPTCNAPMRGRVITHLSDLKGAEPRFGTIYADPPWHYDNTSSRGAANNHYRTMTVDEICAEPVRQLVAEQAHLHLWTTNAFLPAAFKVIDAWGFRYKSCLLWIKDEIGMGNYWRVSHEFLLLGVRGNLRFRERNWPSWIQHRRSRHSHKPARIRLLVERVSPGPYLEMYGREELHDPDWTVYGNQVERRLF